MRLTTRRVALTLVALVVLLLGAGHIVFGLANFQPGFPKLEGLAALIAGAALIGAVVVTPRSIRRALLVALLGAVPLAVWFFYGVTVDGSSDPIFLWLSLVVPAAAGTALIVSRPARG